MSLQESINESLSISNDSNFFHQAVDEWMTQRIYFITVITHFDGRASFFHCNASIFSSKITNKCVANKRNCLLVHFLLLSGSCVPDTATLFSNLVGP